MAPGIAAGGPLPIVFGPVLTRRLGWSLGVNNIRPKTCSYSCVYCQVGRTTRARVTPEIWLDPTEVGEAVRARVKQCRAAGDHIDAISFVPDGEPTLDAQLGASIRSVRGEGPLVAVISNGSLLARRSVRDALAEADWVSLKVDTVDTDTWRRLNRPVRSLDLDTVLDAMRRFASEYRGRLVTETMLVNGLNDDEPSVRAVARFVRSLDPRHAYITLPMRPGAEAWVRPPPEPVARAAADTFARHGIRTSLLRADETETLVSASTDPVEGLVGILAVHPLTERTAREHLRSCGGDWSDIEALIQVGRVIRVDRDGTAYLRVDHTSPGARPALLAAFTPSPRRQRARHPERTV
jgi:wyosine [tRNA(Phe)-imidazoG37] synthetase (radical SAM superfamily)